MRNNENQLQEKTYIDLLIIDVKHDMGRKILKFIAFKSFFTLNFLEKNLEKEIGKYETFRGRDIAIS